MAIIKPTILTESLDQFRTYVLYKVYLINSYPMEKIINVVLSIIIAMFPVVVAIFFGALIYFEWPNDIGFSFISVLLIVSLWLGFKTFFKIRRRGFSAFLHIFSSSPSIPDNKQKKTNTHKNGMTHNQN